MNARLLKKFNILFEDEINLKSYTNYFIALRDWVINNKYLFINELEKNIRLKMLIQINIDNFDLETIGRKNIVLLYEKERMTGRRYKTTEDLLEEIDYTLWNMVALEADLECDCIDSDLRYIKIQEDRCYEILLKCDFCGQIYNINGMKINRAIKEYTPATSIELQHFKSITLTDNVNPE